MKKNKPSISDAFFTFFQTTVALLADTFKLALLEVKLSAKSILIICSLAILLLVIAMTTWLCFLAALAFYFIHLGLSASWVFFIIGFFNLLPIIPIILFIRRYLKQISLDETLKQLSYTSSFSPSSAQTEDVEK